MPDFKDFRKTNRLTQKDAADFFGCTQGFISQIEKGTRPIPHEFISKAYSALKGWDVSSLIISASDIRNPPKNPFSQMTEQEMEDINARVIAEELTKAYKRGDIYPAEVHNRIIAEKDKKIEKLQRENWDLQRVVSELRKEIEGLSK